MNELPATWMALCLVAFVFGAKHGLDADHLATIDGLTRYNGSTNPRLARLAGTLFSLGHGAVVMLVALVAGSLADGWRTPGWLEAAGVAVSVACLFALGFVNLRAVLVADPRTIVAPAGIKSRLLGRYFAVHRAWAVAGVGALFALSFDTVSQAALLALAAGRFGGVVDALFLAGLFVAGMLAMDGLNGVWISRLIRRADRGAIVASRVMAVAVGGISLAVGVLTLTRWFSPVVDEWTKGREPVFGAAVVIGVLAAFAFAMLAARRQALDVAARDG